MQLNITTDYAIQAAFMLQMKSLFKSFEVIDCNNDIQQAATAINASLFTIFAVNMTLSAEQISQFNAMLLPVWRRGVMVGERNDALAVSIFQSHLYADCLIFPWSDEEVEQMFGKLDYWRQMWLGIGEE